MFRYLKRGFTDSDLFLKCIVPIALFMVPSVFSQWVVGAPPHAIIPYSIYGFINTSNIYVFECSFLDKFPNFP